MPTRCVAALDRDRQRQPRFPRVGEVSDRKHEQANRGVGVSGDQRDGSLNVVGVGAEERKTGTPTFDPEDRATYFERLSAHPGSDVRPDEAHPAPRLVSTRGQPRCRSIERPSNYPRCHRSYPWRSWIDRSRRHYCISPAGSATPIW